jgi:peptidoglycan/xylan/chitin deacetylase (PgdA/CDA1 family)
MTRLKAWLDPRAPTWRSPVGRRARGGLEVALLGVASVVAWTQRLRGPGNGMALVYHRLGAAAGDPARELLPAIAVPDFERQVALAARHYRLVTASELVAVAAGRRRGARLPLAITFDDDDPSHARFAAPALVRLGAPATFFLCGGFRTYWWDRVQQLADAGRLAEAGLPEEIHAAARAITAMSPRERTEIDHRLASLTTPSVAFHATDVTELTASGFEIGFHTRDHHPLDTLADDELAAALHDGRDELSAAAAQPLRTIAYPHGRADTRTPAAAAAAGFTVGYTTGGEPLRPSTDPRLIGRLEPSSPSLAVFALKLAAAHLRR